MCMVSDSKAENKNPANGSLYDAGPKPKLAWKDQTAQSLELCSPPFTGPTLSPPSAPISDVRHYVADLLQLFLLGTLFSPISDELFELTVIWLFAGFLDYFIRLQKENQEVSKMIGSFLTRGLVMLFGYAYPAYECYKTVELNKPEIEQLRFWCQYWILVAVLTVGERFCDAFISWVPMYSEAKLAFIIYLWYPKTKGTSYVYDSFFRPYMAKHETEIDRNLLELRTRAGDMAILYWQRAASYGQTRIYEILQYVAAQSTPKRRPAQPQPQGTTVHQHVPPTRPPATTQMESNIASSSSSIPSSNQQQNAAGEEVGPSLVPPKPAFSVASSSIEKAASSSFVKAACSSIEKAASSIIEMAASSTVEKAASSSIEKVAVGSETTSQSGPTGKVEPQPTEPVAPATEENANPPPKETVMEETIRATRGRLRKNRSIGK